MAHVPSGTVTFLFADLYDGFHEESDPEQNRIALEDYDVIFRRAMESNDGYTYKKVSDAFQVAFPTAEKAIAAAAQVQRELSNHLDGSARLRIALHTGVTEMRDGGYVGPLLNRVARVLAAAHGGQVLLTEATEELVRHELPPGVALRDLGEHRLKDLIRAEHIFQLDYADAALVFPPLRTLDSQPNNLPLQATSLVGRQADVEAVRADLLRNDVCLLTLVGAGGIGKTRLALQVATELLDDFADGVFFVNLAPIMDAELVIPSIGQTLDVVESGGQPMFNAVKEYLRDKHLLLVLDNCEQVLQAASRLAELLNAAPGLKVLATSRAPLRLSLECEYHVPALPVPERATVLSVQALMEYESIELFVSRARAVRPDFAIDDLNKEAIAEICRKLDGLPLAIELAAARTKVLTPEAILARMPRGGTGKLLTGGSREMPTRQQTLRNTIQWSYDLLTSDERRLFNRLAIFVGGHSLEAAEALCEDGRSADDPGASSHDSFDVLEAIASLVDKSLVVSKEVGGESRFLMLETLHEFALERLHLTGEYEAVKNAHALYYRQLAETAEPQLITAAQGEWLARLDIEHDNLRAALDRLQEEAASAEARIEIGRISGALWRFWFRRGYMSEGRRRLMLALQYVDDLPDAVRAKVLHGVGVLSYEQGDYAQAKGYFEESLAIRRKLGDKMGMIASLNNLANVALYGSDFAGAAPLYEEALRLARDLGDNWSMAITLGNRGWVEMNKGDYDQAAALYEESLALRRMMHDEWGIANALDNLAWARTYQGRFAEAESLAASSMTIFEKLGDKDSISDLFDILGRCAASRADYDGARTFFANSLTLNRELEDKAGSALALFGLAALAVEKEEWERAARLFGAADALRASTADFQRYYFRKHEALAQERLGETRFERLSAEGRAMTLEQAVVFALQEASQVGSNHS